MQDEATPFLTLVATLESSLFFLSFCLQDTSRKGRKSCYHSFTTESKLVCEEEGACATSNFDWSYRNATTSERVSSTTGRNTIHAQHQGFAEMWILGWRCVSVLLAKAHPLELWGGPNCGPFCGCKRHWLPGWNEVVYGGFLKLATFKMDFSSLEVSGVAGSSK